MFHNMLSPVCVLISRFSFFLFFYILLKLSSDKKRIFIAQSLFFFSLQKKKKNYNIAWHKIHSIEYLICRKLSPLWNKILPWWLNCQKLFWFVLELLWLFFHNFRSEETSSLDYDIIYSSACLMQWLQKKVLQSIYYWDDYSNFSWRATRFLCYLYSER